MSDCNLPNQTIPGIWNNTTPVNSNERVFNKDDGSINLLIHSTELDDPTPSFETYISLDNAREKEVFFHDPNGFYVDEVITDTGKDYYLRISPCDLLLARNTYVLRTYVDGVEKKLSLTIRTHPKLPNIEDYKRDSSW